MKAGEIYVDIGGNLGPLDSAIDTAKSTVTREGASLGSAFSSAMSQTALAGVTAAIVATGAAITYGISSAGNMEQIRTSFDVMLGSAEKGAAMFKELSEMANTTPFDTEDLAASAKTLLGFGVAVNDIKPDLRMLGDIAQGNKDNFRSLALAFAQVSSAGKLQGQDLLQMINSGFNPLQIISQKTGKSMEELRKEMEKGGISSDMVRDAMITATSAGGQFFEGMEKGSKTFPGLVSTITDNAGKVARSLVGMDAEGNIKSGSLFDRIKKAASSLGDALTTLSADIDKVGIAKALDKMIPPKFQYAIVIIAGAVMGAAVPAFIALAAAAWAALVPLLPWIAAGAAIAGVAFLIYKNWEPIKAFFINSWKAIVSTVTGIWISIKTTASNVWTAIADFFTRTVPKTVLNVITWFAQLPGRIPGLLADLAGKVLYWIGYAAGWLIRKTIEGITRSIEFWAGLPGKVLDFLVKFASFVFEKAGQAKDWLIEKAAYGVNAAVNWFAQLPGRVWHFISQLPGKIIAAVAGASSAAGNLGKSILDGIVAFVKSIPDRVMTYISNLKDRLIGVVGNLYNAAKRLAGKIWEGFKAGLGIKSPSYIEKALDNIMGASETALKALRRDIGEFNAIDVPATKLAFIGFIGTGPNVAFAGAGGPGSTTDARNYGGNTIYINVTGGSARKQVDEIVRELARRGIKLSG